MREARLAEDGQADLLGEAPCHDVLTGGRACSNGCMAPGGSSKAALAVTS
jgi:hypothetical protein